MYPFFVSIEPAAVCQLYCPQCPVGQANARHTRPISPADQILSIERFIHVLHALPRSVRVMQFYFQGEPTLNPHLPEMIHMARMRKIHCIVSTNAQSISADYASRLVRSGLNRIIVSMDGLTQHSYEQYRIGGDIQKTKQALHLLREQRDILKANTPIIELQCLRLKSNEQQWQQMQQTYRLLGADKLTFKTAQFYDFSRGNPLMPTNPRFNRYHLGSDGQWHIPRTRFCLRLLTGCVITTTGDVLPCCYDKDRNYPFGNILNQSFYAIWHGAVRRDFLKRVFLGAGFPMCYNCVQ